MNVSASDLLPLLPVGVLCATGMLLLMYEVFSEQSERSYAAQFTVVGFGLAIFLMARGIGGPTAYVFGPQETAPLIVDTFARVALLLLLAGGLVATLLSPAYAANAGHAHGEYYALIVFSVVGMAVMVMAGDLFTFFLGLETMSIAVYALTGLRQNDPRSPEAALKYFLMGAFATGFLLVWHYPDLRRDRLSGAQRPASQRSARRDPEWGPDARDGAPADSGRLRVQSGGGALSYVGAGHLRGRADAGHGLHGRRRERRRPSPAFCGSSWLGFGMFPRTLRPAGCRCCRRWRS